MALKSQTSPSLPSPSAAGLPLHRGQTAGGNVHSDLAASQKVAAASDGDTGRRDGIGCYGGKMEPNLPSGTPGRGVTGEGTTTETRGFEQFSR